MTNLDILYYSVHPALEMDLARINWFSHAESQTADKAPQCPPTPAHPILRGERMGYDGPREIERVDPMASSGEKEVEGRLGHKLLRLKNCAEQDCLDRTVNFLRSFHLFVRNKACYRTCSPY